MIKKVYEIFFINDEFFPYVIIKKFRKNQEYKRLFSNFTYLSFLQVANYIFPLIAMPYLIRVIGVEYVGLLGFATSTISYLQIITDYGFNLSATRRISVYRNDRLKLIEIFSSVIMIKVTLLFVAFLILLVLIYGFEKFNKDALIFFISFGIVIGDSFFPLWFFQGMEHMKYITYLNVLAKGIFTLAVFIFVKKQNNYYLVPLFTSLGSLISTICSIYIIKNKFGIIFRFQELNTVKKYFYEGWHIFVSSIFSAMYRNANTFILGLLTNNTIVGYYFIAEKIVKVLQSLQGIVGNTLFPYFSKKFNVTNKFFFDLNDKFLKIIFFIYLSMSLITLFSAKYIIYILAGEFNRIMILNLQIISFVILIGGFNYYYGILGLVTMSYEKDFSQCVIITGLLNLFFCSILVYLFPYYGAAISLVVSESILLLLLFLKILKIKKNLNN
ncbi:MAG: flippase [Elusimicrobiota bacterium]